MCLLNKIPRNSLDSRVCEPLAWNVERDAEMQSPKPVLTCGIPELKRDLSGKLGEI